MLKRKAPASKKAQTSSKHAKTETPLDRAVEKTIAKVKEALLNEQFTVEPEVSADVRGMLANGLPAMFCDFKEDRVDFQVRMIEIVQQHLERVEKGLQRVLTEKKAISDAENEKRQGVEAEKVAAKEVFQQKQEAREGREADQRDCEEKLSEAEGQLKNAEENGEKAAKAHASHVKEHASMTNIIENNLKLLKESTTDVTSGSPKKRLNGITPFLKKIKIDDSLRKAVPLALQKAVENRAAFDTLAIDSLEQAFQTALGELEVSVKASASENTEAEALTATNGEKLTTAKAALDAAREATAAAEAEETDCKGKLKEAEKALRDFDKQAKKFHHETTDAQAELDLFEDVKEAFSFLESRSQPFEESEDAGAEEMIPLLVASPQGGGSKNVVF